jgi:preprotein translocase subunit SecE
MSKIGSYIKETRGELRQVKWPSRRQTVLFTVFVVVVSLATAVYLGVFDFIFSRVLRLVF